VDDFEGAVKNWEAPRLVSNGLPPAQHRFGRSARANAVSFVAKSGEWRFPHHFAPNREGPRMLRLQLRSSQHCP
jgi:hypothetical protein